MNNRETGRHTQQLVISVYLPVTARTTGFPSTKIANAAKVTYFGAAQRGSYFSVNCSISCQKLEELCHSGECSCSVQLLDIGARYLDLLSELASQLNCASEQATLFLTLHLATCKWSRFSRYVLT